MSRAVDPLYLDVGAMRNRIALLQPSQVSDDSGGVGPPSEFGDGFWAELGTITGQEIYRIGERISEATLKVTMRWIPGIDASFSVTFNGRNLQVMYVENVAERNVKLYLYCKEVT